MEDMLNPKTAHYAGIAFVLVGAYLLYYAHEKQGKERPFYLRFISGLT
jgi:hypothetical protein